MRYVTPRDYHQTNWLMIDLEEEYNDSNDSFASLKSDVDVNSMDDIGSICDLYEKEGDQTSHTVPLLYDAKLQTIVNNNADDICHMLKNCFEDEEKQNTDNSRDELYEWMYPILSSWSNPSPQVVLSFCTRQQLNAALNRAVYTLTQQRYLNATDSLTEADLRLFVTLIHYDQICASFSVAQSPLALLYQQPVLMDYCRDIYQQMAGATKKGLVVGEAMADALKLPHQRHLM